MPENPAEFAESRTPNEAAAGAAPSVDAPSQPLAAVRALAAAIVHELNNPIAAILLSATTVRKSLQDSGATQSLAGDVEVMTQAAERCAKAVGQIAHFARGEPLGDAPPTLTAALHVVRESLTGRSPAAHKSPAG